VIERGSERLVTTEISILRELRGCPHVVQLLEVITEPQYILVFEQIKSIDKNSLFELLTPTVVQMLLKSVLEALVAAHSHGIVHRDIKLGNILVTDDLTNAVLIDWGCGAVVTHSLGPTAGSRSTRSPEMLMGYRKYETRGDIWSFGVLILSILSAGFIPWRASSVTEEFIKMSAYFGGRNLRGLGAKYGCKFPDLEDGEAEWKEEADATLESEFSEELVEISDPRLVDLMMRCLVIDPGSRPTAQGLLQHPYFQCH
jgi:casein kinase II subunit alpha